MTFDIILENGNTKIVGSIESVSDELEKQLMFKFHRASKDAGIEVTSWIQQKVLPLVAKKTGLLRTAYMDAIETNLHRGRDYADVTFEFNMSKLLSNVFRDNRYYSKYHITGHPEFRFPFGYRKPTTPGTKPISFQYWETKVEPLYSKLLRSNLIVEGLAL